ncbi:cytochrome P450 [Trametes coccinea BRFM310]|uniref:Cytochrome P450 n=1 Tax=Trametes coccinea (strain BRFM310) TaxID=1353009 RepID=A0A1Y2IYA2_TRAC3|nr:cytochrome P450 [Trametes coccinea BRFM310]
MVSPLLQAVTVCSFTWFLWKFFRKFVVKTDLDNLPGPTSPSFIYGNLKQLYDRRAFKYHRQIGEEYGSVVRLHGRFGENILYTYDPKAMHHIVIKDQEVFEASNWFIRMLLHLFGPGLLSTLGDHHRKQRKMLNPVFSINHMRHMTPIFYNVSHKLRSAIETQVRSGETEVDMVGWMARTALELMGQAGLGYSFDPLLADSKDEFGEALKNLMPTLSKLRGLQQYFPLFEAIVPPGWRRPIAKLVPWSAPRRVVELRDILRKRSTEIYEEKKAALLRGDEALKQQVGEGKDLMSILLKANMEASEENKLPEEELIGQVSTLTFAAMDTTSNALSFTLWRLAQNPGVQAKLRQEILEAKEACGGGDIGYDDLVSLPYLDAVCRETLRIHVPAPIRFREAKEDIVLPLSEPVRGRDGKLMHQILVPKASNTNKDLWGEDAYEWKPERWLQPLPEKVLDAKIPGVMTFWGGGRACIGFKFSQLEMKIVLADLISSFKFELSKPIYWNMAGVQYPSADPRGDKAEMPMKIGGSTLVTDGGADRDLCVI